MKNKILMLLLVSGIFFCGVAVYASCNNSKGTSAVQGYICYRYNQLSWLKIAPLEKFRAKCDTPAVKFFCSVGQTLNTTTNYYQHFNPDLAGSCTGPLIASWTEPYTFTFTYVATCKDEPEKPSD